MVVERGLMPGEEIVTEGFHKLSPGMKVRVEAVSKEIEPADSTATVK